MLVLGVRCPDVSELPIEAVEIESGVCILILLNRERNSKGSIPARTMR